MFATLASGKARKQLAAVAHRPMSRRARQLLDEARVPIVEGYPALVQLLSWAVDEADVPSELRAAGEACLGDLTLMLANGNVLGAYQVLTNELEEGAPARLPEIMDARDLKQAAQGILELARLALA